MNPVYWLDLRIRARERRLWVIGLIFVAALSVVAGMSLMSTMDFGLDRHLSPSSIGQGIVWSTLFCHAVLLMILAPLGAAGRVAQEREQRTLPALINSPASALSITLGKLWGAWSFTAWISMFALPFLAAGWLWGGLGLGIIVSGFLLNILVGFLFSIIAIGWSCLFRRSLTAYLVAGSFLFGWMAVVPLMGALAMSMFSHWMNTPPEWPAYLAFYHQPLFPLIALASTDWMVNGGEMAFRLVYCLLVWGILSALFIRLSVVGLKRDVY